MNHERIRRIYQGVDALLRLNDTQLVSACKFLAAMSAGRRLDAESAEIRAELKAILEEHTGDSIDF
jgi:hypothetical protein